MRFLAAMAAMAVNKSHVEQFAARVGWDTAKAEAALTAYGTGKFFPSLDELRAMGAGDSLLWAYRSALASYHLDRIVVDPVRSQELYALIKKPSVERWRNGLAIPSGKTRAKIEQAFGLDLESVPAEAVFLNGGAHAKLKLDLRRNRLRLGDFVTQLIALSENQYAIPQEAMQQGFVDAARDSALAFVECGDFMRAEPAPKVYIYYAKP